MKYKEILEELKKLDDIVLLHIKSGESSYNTHEVYSLFSRYESVHDRLIKIEPSVFSYLPRNIFPFMKFSHVFSIELKYMEILSKEIEYLIHVLSMKVGDKIASEQQNHYVNIKRIEELERINNNEFDLEKLIEFCKDLNKCHFVGAILAVPVLVRAILDHVPPIFEKQNFDEVANNYGFTISNKRSILKLQESSRNIANSFLHTQIRKKEVLPNETQVDFKIELDVLLQEIVRKFKD